MPAFLIQSCSGSDCARAYSLILKISRTVAGLDASAQRDSSHVAEAIQYRT